MFKKITYVIVLAFFVTSCADTFGSVKRGLTGAKQDSTDEFLISDGGVLKKIDYSLIKGGGAKTLLNTRTRRSDALLSARKYPANVNKGIVARCGDTTIL